MANEEAAEQLYDPLPSNEGDHNDKTEAAEERSETATLQSRQHVWDVEPTPLDILRRNGIDVDDLPEVLLDRTKDSAIRVQAAFGIAQIGHIENVGVLHRAMTEPDVDVRSAAISAIAYVNTDESIDLLGDVIRNDLQEKPRAAATISLFAIGSDAAAENLAVVATNSYEYHRTRLTALTAIDSIGFDPAIVQIEPLLEDANASVRLKTAVLITRSYDSRHLGSVVSGLSSDADIDVLVEAVEFLEEVSGEEFSNPLTDGVHLARAEVNSWWSKSQ